MVTEVRFDTKRNVRIFKREGYIIIDLRTGNLNSSITGMTLSGQTYDTWYEFKKDIESLCGHPVLNKTWLRIKPQVPLPWGTSQVLTVLSKIT